MKSEIERTGVDFNQYKKPKSKSRLKLPTQALIAGASTVSAVVGLSSAAAAASTPNHSVTTTTAKTGHETTPHTTHSSHNSKDHHKKDHHKPKHHKKPVKKPTPTTTTTTTTPWVASPNQNSQYEAYPSDKLIGAVVIKRVSPLEAGQSDDLVVHRLNTGQWTGDLSGLGLAGASEGVDDTPMLDNGPVYDQSSAAPGTLGETTIISAHDVTQINAPVSYLGQVWTTQREVTASANVQPNPGDPYADTNAYDGTPADTNPGQGNMIDGDQIEIAMNNPNGTMTTYDYTIYSRNVIAYGNQQEATELDNPPTERTESQLVWYDCWEPHSEAYREVFRAIMTGTPTTTNGQVTAVGPNSPNASATNQ